MKKSGAWYTYDGEQLGQGRENAKVFLAEHPEVMVEISERIRSQLGIGSPGASSNGSTNGSGNGTEHLNGADDAPISLDEPITLDD